MQRVRVGMTGLASVMILIGLASVLFSSAHDEAPVAAVGAAKPDIAANMTDGIVSNSAAPKADSEPLAELGVAPSTSVEPANSVAPEPVPAKPATPK